MVEATFIAKSKQNPNPKFIKILMTNDTILEFSNSLIGKIQKRIDSKSSSPLLLIVDKTYISSYLSDGYSFKDLSY